MTTMTNISLSNKTDVTTGSLAIHRDWNVVHTIDLNPASYIIYKEGSAIKAINGTTGIIDFSGNDAATVINNALKNGYLCLIRHGTYQLNSPLYMPNYTSIVGEGNNTVLSISSHTGGGIITQGNNNMRNLYIDASDQINDNAAIHILNSSNVNVDNISLYANRFGFYIQQDKGQTVNNIHIKNNYLKGNGNNDIIGGGSYVSNSTNCSDIYISDNILIHDCTTNTYQGAIALLSMYRLQVHHNNVQGTILLGSERYPEQYCNIIGNIVKPAINKTSCFIGIANNTSANSIDRNVNIANNNIQSGGIFVTGISGQITPYVSISGNTVTNNATAYGIYLKYCNNSCITGNTIYNMWDAIKLEYSNYNTIIGNNINTAIYGYLETGTSDYNIFINNILSGMINNKVTLTGAHTNVKDNIGYNNIQTILNGTTTGTLVWSMPDRSPEFKRFIGYLNGYVNDTGTSQTVTFPITFTNIPTLVVDNSSGTSVSTTTLTLPNSIVSPITGWIIVEGY